MPPNGILFAYFDFIKSATGTGITLKKTQFVRGHLKSKASANLKLGDLVFQVQGAGGEILAESQERISKRQPYNLDRKYSFDVKISWTASSRKLVVYEKNTSLKKIEEYDLQTILALN